jgi:hypothetical protein
MKADKTSVNSELFKTHQTHSIAEVLAAGGATAFGIKSGKNNETIIAALQKTPAEPFTEEEWIELLRELDATK